MNTIIHRRVLHPSSDTYEHHNHKIVKKISILTQTSSFETNKHSPS